MMELFLDLLEGLHRWCVVGQGEDLPVQLVQARSHLAAKLQICPTSETEWISLWQAPLGTWWPTSLPESWSGLNCLLSRRESTLTVEALLLLEEHRPGIVMLVLREEVVHQLPSVGNAGSEGKTGRGGVKGPIATTPQWNLQDLVMCVVREVSRRERSYPHLIHQYRLTEAQAQQELSQMRAVQSYLLSKLREGITPEQQVLF